MNGPHTQQRNVMMHSDTMMHSLQCQANPFSKVSNEELLEQLKAFTSYTDTTQVGRVLLAEVYQRAEASLSKTHIPSKEQHGSGYLYSSVYKDGIFSHYFVDDQNTKDIIDGIFAKTGGDPRERVRLLLELGVVFRLVRVDEEGKQVGGELGASFLNLFTDKGFGEEPRHASLALPAVVISCNVEAITNQVLFEQVVARHAYKGDKVDTDQVRRYLKDNDVLGSFLNQHEEAKTKFPNNPHWTQTVPVQIHVFAKGEPTQVRVIVAFPDNKEWLKKCIIPNNGHSGIAFAIESPLGAMRPGFG